MKLLILLTTFMLITTQLLMLHAQGFKEKKNERQMSLNDVIRKGEFLTRHKRDADDKGESVEDDQSSSGSQAIGSTRRGINLGLSSNILGSRGSFGLDFTPPNIFGNIGNPSDYNQDALYRAYLLRNRGGGSSGGSSGGSLNVVTNGLGKMLDTDVNKIGVGLDTTLGHLTDHLADILGANDAESKTGGLLGLDFLTGGTGRFLGGLLGKISHGVVHSALDDASHLTHGLLNPGGSLGGSIGIQGSLGGRFNPALQYYGYYH